MDEIDIRILELIQTNGRVANADLARELQMAPSAVLERVRKLEQRKIISGFSAKLDPKSLGLGLTAFLFVQTESTKGPTESISSCAAVASGLAALPEVLEVHNVAGEDCFLIKVCVQDTSHLASLLRDKIRVLPAIRSTRTTIVLETTKETTQLPLDHLKTESKKHRE
ncbi:MAG: Lrp/AsnC family transcriptional regulator [Pirellulales bacterium]